MERNHLCCYRPQQWWQKGYVFAGVCLSTGGWGVYTPPWADPPPPNWRWLLQPTVRILLECIPVFVVILRCDRVWNLIPDAAFLLLVYSIYHLNEDPLTQSEAGKLL